MDQAVLLLANFLLHKMIRLLPQQTSNEIVSISALKRNAPVPVHLYQLKLSANYFHL